MLKPKDYGSDIPFISFVTMNKFLHIPKSQFPHLLKRGGGSTIMAICPTSHFSFPLGNYFQPYYLFYMTLVKLLTQGVDM